MSTKKNLALNNELIRILSLDSYPTVESLVAVQLSDGDLYLTKNGMIVTVDGKFVKYTPPKSVGDEYGGGKIAYLGSEGDFENGMISATADQSTGIQWGCRGTTIGGNATSTAIGTGAAATAAIVAGCDNAEFAAKLCYDLDLNGYTDWFLPSHLELNELYQNMDTIGGFSANLYWSSSEVSSRDARIQGFGTGGVGFSTKSSTNRVRAVRGFPELPS